MKTLIARIVGALLILDFTAAAFGATIAVSNPSFEVLPASGLPLTAGCQGSGCSFNAGVGAIPGWTNSGASGEAILGTQVGNYFAFDVIPDGITSAYSNGPTISQTVGSSVELGQIYTLLVDLGVRHDVPGFSATGGLFVNGMRYAAVGATPAPGNWSTFAATYIGLAADVGAPIIIELSSAVAGFPPQANFDNVRLSAVPEPASAYMLAMGFAGLLVFARLRRGSLAR